MMTAYSVDDLIEEAFAEGALKVLRKPLNVDELVRLIASATVKPLILVVDDDLEFCQVMKDILEGRGYMVAIAINGPQAIDMSKSTSYDLIFIDMKLPTINGLETYLGIKESAPRAKAVMMTAYREEMGSLAEEAVAKCALTCLYKPFAPEEMMKVVEGALWGRGGWSNKSAYS
jgi:CheY-like chemotaxis protein